MCSHNQHVAWDWTLGKNETPQKIELMQKLNCDKVVQILVGDNEASSLLHHRSESRTCLEM